MSGSSVQETKSKAREILRLLEFAIGEAQKAKAKIVELENELGEQTGSGEFLIAGHLVIVDWIPGKKRWCVSCRLLQEPE